MTLRTSFDFRVAWAYLDANNHLANAGFFDYVTEARMLYFESAGYPPTRMADEGIGPVVLTDQASYQRELRHLDPFNVTIALGGANPNNSRFVLAHRFTHADGTLCATVRSNFIWFSRTTRKRIIAPPELLKATLALPRDDLFEDL